MFYASQYHHQPLSNDSEFATIANENDTIKRSARSTTLKPNKQLPEKAIHLMNAWYIANEENPYPNRNDLDYLATNGGIKESQVKAWFSNKRNRTQNTHPKRAKRYLVRHQLQQNPSSWDEPEKIHVADQLEQRANSSVPSVASHWTWLPTQSYDYATHYYAHQS